MIRNLIIAIFIVVLMATLSMPFVVLHPGEFVLGGQSHITAETPSDGDISFFFAQVMIDKGSSVGWRS